MTSLLLVCVLPYLFLLGCALTPLRLSEVRDGLFTNHCLIFESVTLNFRDLDGEDNGGQFETKYQQVTLSQDNYEANDVEVIMNK